MKKSKFLKILAPIVALGLLIGALFTVSASATTDEGAADAKAPEIISMNVEYGSELYLYYAVDKGDAEGTPKLEVLSDAEGTEIEYTVTYYTTETVHDKECYVFKTKGVAPKELNKAQYVRAVVGEEASEIKAASVELYLNTRLYKNGFAAKTAADGEDYTRRNLYYQLLKYGNSAQKLLVEGDFEAIGKPGLYFAEGSSELNGSYTAGNYVALKAAAVEGKTFSYWKVEEYSVFGEAVGTRLLGDGYEYVLRRSAVVTPVYDAEDTSEVELWDPAKVSFNYAPSEMSYHTNVAFGTNAAFTADPEDPANNVLAFYPNAKTIAWTYVVDQDSIPADANVAIVEYRIWLGARDKNNGSLAVNTEMYFTEEKYIDQKTTAASLFILNGANVQAYRGAYYTNSAGNVTGKHDSVKNVASGAVIEGWNDVRIEYRVKEADGVKTPEWKVYVNGALKITYEGMHGAMYYEREGTDGITTSPHTLVQDMIPAVTDINRFNVTSSSSLKGGAIYYDDIKISHIKE